MNPRVCRQCGVNIEQRPHRRGPKPLYCSASCRARHCDAHRPMLTKTCGHCGSAFQTRRAEAIYDTPACFRAAQRGSVRKRHPRPCLRCGEAFKPLVATGRRAQRYCSRACARPPRVARTCERCGEPFVPKGADRLRFCSRACAHAYQREHHLGVGWRPETIPPPRLCVECGASLPKGHWRTCSDGCMVARASRLSRDQNSAKKPLLERLCQECQRTFVPTYGDKHRSFCSNGCQRHAQHDRTSIRRARRLGVAWEPINRTKVFVRDGWRCQLCGARTLKTWRPKHPRSPELDHIIPLAKRGSHTYANVQLAHLRCNAAKRARPLGQLRLV